MSQIDLFELLGSADQSTDNYNIELVERMNRLVPGWEVVGYAEGYKFLDWHTEYSTIVWNQKIYHWLCIEIGKKDRLSYVERSDFEPSWFEKGTWRWISDHHREGVFEAARKNIGVFKRHYYFQ